jgi:TRAP-type C4-dicarboxylate transport system permease small subunit
MSGFFRLARESLASLTAIVLAGIMLVTVIDVIGRYMINRPLPGSSEITELAMALLIYTALPLASRSRAHITVDLFDALVPSAVRPVRDIIIQVVSAAVLALIAWRLWTYADQLRGSGDVTEYLKLAQAPFAYAMSVLAGLAAIAALAITRNSGAPSQTVTTSS